MPRPRFAYFAADALLSPLRLEARKTGDAGPAPGLVRLVLPEVQVAGGGMPSRLAVHTSPRTPFGPSESQLLALLPCSLDEAVRVVGDALSLPATIARGRNRPERAGTAVIGLHELAKLHAAVTKGAFEDAVLVSCFIRPGQVYAARVPRGAPLGEVLAALPEVKAHMADCPHDGPLNPLIGDPVDLSQPCRAPHSLVSFPGNGYALAPVRSFLFPFPTFNRTLAMREGTAEPGPPGPCSNCLACVRYCPAGIQPSLIYHYLAAGKQEDALPLGLSRCTECGWCSFVCPSRLPLCRQMSAGIAALVAEEAEREDTEAEEAGDA